MERIRLIAHGDIFEVSRHFSFPCIVVPTNRQIKANGKLVMGGGLARAALIHAEKYGTDVAKIWGQEILDNVPYHKPTGIHQNLHFMGVHTKVHWKDSSTMELVAHAMDSIYAEAEKCKGMQFLIPLLGAGLGGLPEKKVVDYIHPRLSNNMVMVIPTHDS